MKIIEILEENNDDLSAIAKELLANCQPWFSAINYNYNIRVYRGLQGYTGDLISLQDVRTDRRPLHSSQAFHDALNQILADAGFAVNRSNCVFVVGAERVAALYGKPCVVIPRGHFDYVWNTEYRDMFEVEHELKNCNTYDNPEKQKQNIFKTISETFTDKELELAIQFNHEIMIKCDNYYAIDVDFYNKLVPVLQQSKSQHIQENDEDNLGREEVKEIAYAIYKNCQPWLKEIKYDLKKVVYRGLFDSVGVFAEMRTRTDRKPKNSTWVFNDIYNEILEKDGFGVTRNNCAFVTGDRRMASNYGKPYVFIPKGEFKFVWNTAWDDLFDFECEYRGELTDYDRVEDEPDLQTKIKDRLAGTFINTDLDQAIKSGHEIMINCASYYVISENLYDEIFFALENYLNPDTINEQTLLEGPNDPHIFKAVFMVGGPGSGKSWVAQQIASHTGLRLINPDQWIEFVLQKQNMQTDNLNASERNVYQQHGKKLSNIKQNTAMNGRQGLIIDVTGRNYAKLVEQKNLLESLGYDTMMVFVNTNLKTAIDRNNQRIRKVDLPFLIRAHRDVQDNLGKYQRVFKKVEIFDNSDDFTKPELLSQLSSIWRSVNGFINTKPKNPIALNWLKFHQKRQ